VANDRKDWAAIAAEAWSSPSWSGAARDYHERRAGQPTINSIDPVKVIRLRRLLDDDVSLDQMYRELNTIRGRLPAATIQALDYLLQQQKEPARLRAWMAQHGAEERRLMGDHIKGKCDEG
jgi:hypothetical protein